MIESRGANVIGISAHYHDSACAVLCDGVLVAAAQEERFTRVKHDARVPRRAFRYCLEQAGLAITDIDRIAYYEDPQLKLARNLWMLDNPELPRRRLDAIARRLDPAQPLRDLRELLGFTGPLDLVSHHEAHAASTYYFSGFEEAAVFTVDGVGEWATTTYGRASGAQLELFEEVHFPDSLGMFYAALTAYLGFEVNEGEYKVMGLAPYGKPRYVDQVRKLIEPRPGGDYRLRLEYFDFLTGDRMYSDALVELFGEPPRPPESELRPFHEDVAKSVQVVLEEILLDKVRYLYSRVPSENLCMAGGVALNVVANRRILEEGPFERLFVQPASSDAGSSLGAAAIAHLRHTGERPSKEPLRHVYLGPAFEADDVVRMFERSSAPFEDYRGREAKLIRATVDRLAAGQIIGWFQGRMEFGPRSLGARSILADPRGPEMRDKINALVKKREAFRPFAPVVLASRAHEHFELDHPSPFMLETCPVRSPLSLPAITHVDGSARVQTASADTNPRLVLLLEEFERRTGCPILLNTSFNMRGEPIVCTPADAVACFVRSGLDALVVEDTIIERASIPELWAMHVHATTAASGVGHDIYAFL